MIRVDSGSPTFTTEEAVLFPFDDYSIPFRKDVLMTLVQSSRQPGEYRENASYDPDHPGARSVQHGVSESCDHMEIVFLSIARVGDELRMWYMARGNSDPDAASNEWGSGAPIDQRRSFAYATSKDGIEWENPTSGSSSITAAKATTLSTSTMAMPGW